MIRATSRTFLSLPRLIPTAMPFLSRVAFLCHQKWDSASKLPLLHPRAPILMLSGSRDEIIPREHMLELERLLRETPGRRRRPGKLVEYPGGMHSAWFSVLLVSCHGGAHMVGLLSDDTCVQRGYWNDVADFIDTFC